MITVPPFLAFSLNVNLDVLNNSVSLLSLGIYSGLLTTFPVGPSHLLCVRTFLLKVKERDNKSPITNKLLVAAISGLILSQLLVFLSIYWPPLQALWIKPQVWSCFILPYVFLDMYFVKKFVSDTLLANHNSNFSVQVWTTFVNTFFLQLLNPILFSSPHFVRLISVFLFCYSNKLWFIVGGILGWLSGQVLFAFLNWSLLFRLQYDAPTIYDVLKNRINQVFYVTLFVTFFTCVRQIPDKRFKVGSPPVFQLWPQLIFQEDRSNRPLRALNLKEKKTNTSQNTVPVKTVDISNPAKVTEKKDTLNFSEQVNPTKKNNNLTKDVSNTTEQKVKISNNISKKKKDTNKEPYNKKRFSEYLFEKCLTNGISRLFHTFPQNLIAFSLRHKEVLKILNLSESEQPESNVYKNWVYSQVVRKMQFENILENRIKELDKGESIDTLLDQKTGSKTLDETESIDTLLDQKTGSKEYIENPINKIFDFRLNLKKRSYQSCFFSNENEQVNKHQDKKKLKLIGQAEINKSKPFLWKGHIGSLSLLRNSLNGDGPFKNKNTRSPIKLSLLSVIVSRNLFSEKELLRSTEPQENSNFLSEKQSSRFTKSEVKARLHGVMIRIPRNILLSSQPLIRKNLKFPLLIFLKNTARWLLFQPSEWKDDWADLKQEQYKFLLFDGEEQTSDSSMRPESWVYGGFQIKVVSPVVLRPWRSSVLKPASDCYLSAWGNENEEWFGPAQVQPSFWTPLRKILILKRNYQSDKHSAKMGKLVTYLIYLSQRNLLVLTTTLNSILNKINFFLNKINLFLKKINSIIRVVSQESFDSNNRNMLQNNQIASTKKDQSNFSDLISSVDSQNLSNLQINLANKKEQIQYRLFQIKQASELLQKGKNTKPKKLIQTNLFKPSLVARNINRKTRLQIQIISEPSFKSIQHKHLILKKKLFEIVTNSIQKNTQVKKLEIQWVNMLNKPLQHVNINFLYICKESVIFILRNLRNLANIVESWFNVSNIWSHNVRILNDSEISVKQSHKLNTDIFLNVPSQAHVLHKIWERNTKTKISLSSVINNSKLSNFLTENENTLPLTQSILTKEKTEILTQNTWMKLISKLPQYTPSSKLWVDMVPKKWSSKVQQDWDLKLIGKHQNKQLAQNFQYHQQLVQQAQKLCIQSKCYLIANHFTSFNQDVVLNKSDINDTFNNQTLKKHTLNKSNLIDILSHQDDILNKEKQMLSKTSQTERNTHDKPLVIHDETERNTHDKPLVIHDETVIYNLLSAFLRFGDRGHHNFVNNMSQFLFFKLLKEEQVFPNVSLLIEQILLSNKSREFKVLQSLNLEPKIHNQNNVKPLSSKLQSKLNQLEQKESSCDNVFVNYLNTNDLQIRTSNQITNPTNQVQRFLWPIHRLEDLACMNRFWVGFGNQSRFSALRIKMYPFISS